MTPSLAVLMNIIAVPLTASFNTLNSVQSVLLKRVCQFRRQELLYRGLPVLRIAGDPNERIV